MERKGIVMLPNLHRHLDVWPGGLPSCSVFTPNRDEDRRSRYQTAHSLAHKLTGPFLLIMPIVIFHFIVQMFRGIGPEKCTPRTWKSTYPCISCQLTSPRADIL